MTRMSIQDIFETRELPLEHILTFAPKLDWLYRRSIICSTQRITLAVYKAHKELMYVDSLVLNPKTDYTLLCFLNDTYPLTPVQKQRLLTTRGFKATVDTNGATDWLKKLIPSGELKHKWIFD